ncbi:MAG TPA: phosphatidylglycerophosphatase A [Stellaceae bacterium]|nr:phosphatidylglycerophosphatase A [Stellaceae bacterium]
MAGSSPAKVQRLMSRLHRLGLPFAHPATLIATGLGIGLLPAAPGTWASLAALPCGWLLHAALGPVAVLGAAAATFAAGCWAAARIAKTSGIGDPGAVVIDEIAAQLFVLSACPHDWRFYAAAFVLFRLFDIWKPFPVNWLDRTVKGGFGIMLDDVAAALYALIAIVIGRGVSGV